MKQTIAIPFTPSNSTGVQTMNRVSLPAAPWIEGSTMDRDPRRGAVSWRDVQTPPRRITTAEVVALFRKEYADHIRAQKEGMA